MSACFYIVVEGEDPGFNTFVNGHALAVHESELEQLARALGVAPLLDYFSADRNAMATLLEQGACDPEWEAALPPPQWFAPEAGFNTVTTLLDFLRDHPAQLGSATSRVAQELSEYQRVLEKTAQYGLRWHLAVSWE